MEPSIWDKVSPEFVAAAFMFVVLVTFAKWLITEYFKLTGKVLETMEKTSAALEKIKDVVSSCLDKIEGGHHDIP